MIWVGRQKRYWEDNATLCFCQKGNRGNEYQAIDTHDRIGNQGRGQISLINNTGG